MTIEDRLEVALRSRQPVPALSSIVQDLARDGQSKTEIYEQLTRFLVYLRAQPDFVEADEEPLLDVMDALTDGCHPSAELFPDQPAR